MQFDCGVHPAYSGLSSLPMIDDEFDISTVDLLLVTHFHLDHCAALPYILYKVRLRLQPAQPSRTRANIIVILASSQPCSCVCVCVCVCVLRAEVGESALHADGGMRSAGRSSAAA